LEDVFQHKPVIVLFTRAATDVLKVQIVNGVKEMDNVWMKRVPV